MEVLVATILMGLVLVVLLQILTGALWAQEASWGHARALLTAEKVLSEACSSQKLGGAQYQGQDGPFSYQVRISPRFEVANPTLNRLTRCSLVQVTVSWQEHGRTRSVYLETMRSGSQNRS